MKTTIKSLRIQLTEKQIEQIIESKSKFLLVEKEKAIAKIEKEYNESIAKLRKENKTIEVHIDEVETTTTTEDTKKEKITITIDELKKMYDEGLNTKQIADKTGKSYTSVWNQSRKLNNINNDVDVKLKDL